MEFGSIVTSQYLKHVNGIPVTKLIYNENIGGYLSCTNKQIHVWKSMETFDEGSFGKSQFSIKFFEETGSHNISCLCYCKSLYLYFVVSSDFKLHVFNEYLFYIGHFPLQSRLVNFISIIDENLLIFTGGIDGCFLYQLEVKNKYDQKQSLILDPESEFLELNINFIGPLKEMPTWIKGMKVFNNQNLIVSWSPIKLTFHNFDRNLKYSYNNLTDMDDIISDVLYNHQLKCFVTSSEQGGLIVWKFKKKKQILHRFEDLDQKIFALQEIHNELNLFIAGTLDNTLRVYSLESYQELYVFKIPPGIKKLFFFNENYFGCIYPSNEIKICKFQRVANSYQASTNMVLQIKKSYFYQENEDKTDVNFILSLYNNDSIIASLINQRKEIINQNESKLFQSNFISNIFPPPKAQNIIYMHYFINQRLVLLQQSGGQLIFYNFDPKSYISPSINSIQETQNIVDQKMRKIQQQVTTIFVCKTVPIKFDYEYARSQSADDLLQLKQEMEYQYRKYGSENADKFVVLGMSKGSILFLSLDRIHTLYSRFSVHQEAVERIDEIFSKKVFISICSQMEILIWDFKGSKFNKIVATKIQRPIKQLKCLSNLILIGFETGELHLFQYSEIFNQLLYIQIDDNSLHHNHQISCIDSIQTKNLFVSGCSGGFVKIWNIKKQLIREIKFPEPISSIQFCNSLGDILVSHGKSISIMTSNDYGLNLNKRLNTISQQAFDHFILQNCQLANNQLFLQLKDKFQGFKENNDYQSNYKMNANEIQIYQNFKEKKNQLLSEIKNSFRENQKNKTRNAIMQEQNSQKSNRSNYSESFESLQSLNQPQEKLEQTNIRVQIQDQQQQNQKTFQQQKTNIQYQSQKVLLQNKIQNDLKVYQVEKQNKESQKNKQLIIEKQKTRIQDIKRNSAQQFQNQITDKNNLSKYKNPNIKLIDDQDTTFIKEQIQDQANTTAIPKEQIELEYKRAILREIRQKTKIQGKKGMIRSGSSAINSIYQDAFSTRRERTMGMIRQSLVQYNLTSSEDIKRNQSFQSASSSILRTSQLSNKILINQATETQDEIQIFFGSKEKSAVNSRNLSTKSHSFIKLNPYENFQSKIQYQSQIYPLNIKNVYQQYRTDRNQYSSIYSDQKKMDDDLNEQNGNDAYNEKNLKSSMYLKKENNLQKIQKNNTVISDEIINQNEQKNKQKSFHLSGQMNSSMLSDKDSVQRASLENKQSIQNSFILFNQLQSQNPNDQIKYDKKYPEIKLIFEEKEQNLYKDIQNKDVENIDNKTREFNNGQENSNNQVETILNSISEKTEINHIQSRNEEDKNQLSKIQKDQKDLMDIIKIKKESNDKSKFQPKRNDFKGKSMQQKFTKQIHLKESYEDLLQSIYGISSRKKNDSKFSNSLNEQQKNQEENLYIAGQKLNQDNQILSLRPQIERQIITQFVNKSTGRNPQIKSEKQEIQKNLLKGLSVRKKMNDKNNKEYTDHESTKLQSKQDNQSDYTYFNILSSNQIQGESSKKEKDIQSYFEFLNQQKLNKDSYMFKNSQQLSQLETDKNRSMILKSDGKITVKESMQFQQIQLNKKNQIKSYDTERIQYHQDNF